MLRRWIIYPLQGMFAALGYAVLAALPLDAASALGAWAGRTFGPRLRAHQTAHDNLRRIMPELGETERAAIIRGMWENLGRTVAEYPHIRKFDPYAENGRIEVVGLEHMEALWNDDKPGLLFGGHLANWEVASLAVTRRGWNLHVAYRALNNPLVDRLLRRGRDAFDAGLFPKGPVGAKMALKALSNGEHVAMLVDQKMNDGIPVPFMGVDAMTAPAVARFALRYDCPVVPVQVERLQGARFRITFYPDLEKPETGDRQKDTEAIMAKVNDYLGSWIRRHPEQWLWVHRRWPAEGSEG